MKKFYNLLCFGFLSVLKAQTLYFPPLSGTSWDTLSPQRLGWCQPRIDSLYNYLQVKNTKSFIVLKNGKIVLEKYFGSYTSDSVFYWASASKSLAGFIAGIAQQKGLININNAVSQYLGVGWSSEPPAKEILITVKDLLQMTSGMEDNPPLPCENEDTARACLIYKVDAGTRWAYHTGPYKKVQDVVSAAAGLNYNLVTQNWIKVKTGMSGLWINQTYYSKARDMARFGLLVMNRGTWNGDSLMTDQNYFNAMTNTAQAFNPAYGYLWWLNGKSGFLNPGLQFMFSGPLIPNAPATMFCALGKNDQKIYVAPGEGLVVVRQGNSAEGVTFALSEFDNKLWAYIKQLDCTLTSIVESGTEPALTVYPNPARGVITIISPQAFKNAVLKDMTGKKIDLPVSNGNIQLQGLAPGIYLLEIDFENNKRVFRKITID